MTRLLVLALVIGVVTLHGATYYVATTGANENPGTQAEPWSTIQHAADTVAAGDTVSVAAGTYNEFVTNITSGTAESPIVFQGTMSGTNWLTIIDPSTPLTNGWVAAPEIGAGVYKQTNMAFAVRELTIDNKRVAFIWTDGALGTDLTYVYDAATIAALSLSTGLSMLTPATDATAVLNDGGGTVNYWDGIEAYWVTTTSPNTCYLRLRDGSDPNGQNIRGSPNAGVWSALPTYAAIKLDDKSYVTWRNFAVRGAFCGFWLDTGAHHNTIESNYVSCGWSRIFLDADVYSNTVRANTLTTAYYGTTNLGPWETSGDNVWAREVPYMVAKYLMGSSTSHDYSVRLDHAGGSNVVTGNIISYGLGTGVSMIGSPTNATTGTIISSNTISYHPSVGITLSEGNTETRVFGNSLKFCNAQFRFHHLNASDTNRTVYVYRNVSELEAGAGEHAFLDLTATATNAIFHPTIWFYHNSMLGGEKGFGISSYAEENGGHTNLYVCNNIFTGHNLFFSDTTTFRAMEPGVGAFDYNAVKTNSATRAWFGASNLITGTNFWATNSVPTFQLASDSVAIGAALDVSQSFTLRGNAHSALPDTATKDGAAWDIGALEYETPAGSAGTISVSGTVRAGSIRGP